MSGWVTHILLILFDRIWDAKVWLVLELDAVGAAVTFSSFGFEFCTAEVTSGISVCEGILDGRDDEIAEMDRLAN